MRSTRACTPSTRASCSEALLEHVRPDNAQGEFDPPDARPATRAPTGAAWSRMRSTTRPKRSASTIAPIWLAPAVAQRRIAEYHTRAGVTIVDPPGTVIDAGVVLEADATIAPFSSLHGRTSVRAGSTIGPLSTLIDARVGTEAPTVVHSYVNGAEIGDRKRSVGPFGVSPARHRPARGRQGGHVRRDQELRHRRRGEETETPSVHRRCRHRRAHQHRCRNDHGDLMTAALDNIIMIGAQAFIG